MMWPMPRSLLTFLLLLLAGALFIIAIFDPGFHDIVRVIGIAGLALVVAVAVGYVYPYRRP